MSLFAINVESGSKRSGNPTKACIKAWADFRAMGFKDDMINAGMLFYAAAYHYWKLVGRPSGEFSQHFNKSTASNFVSAKIRKSDVPEDFNTYLADAMTLEKYLAEAKAGKLREPTFTFKTIGNNQDVNTIVKVEETDPISVEDAMIQIDEVKRMLGQ